MKKHIFKREICDELIKYLYTDEILVLHGARQVGKTHILYWLKGFLEENHCIAHYMDMEDSRLLSVLNQDVNSFLQYLKEKGLNHEDFSGKGKDKLFVFVDEIQYLSSPAPFLKLIADHYLSVKLIVSGSSSFDIKSKFTDSLVGRTVNFDIYNLSFKEFLIFKGIKFIPSEVKTSQGLQELIVLFKQFVLHGGYPKITLTDDIERKEKYLQQIIDTYVRKDIRDLANVKDINKFNNLLQILAAQSGQLVNIRELSNTCDIAKQTVEHYLNILESTYIIKRLRPYHKNIRSEISKAPKLFFCDTGLLQMLWLKGLSRQMVGNVFETAIFCEFIKKYGSGNLFFWRTQQKQEIDFIYNKKDKIIPYEAKIRFEKLKTSSLNYFCNKYAIDEYYCIGLEGRFLEDNCIYPWQIGRE